MLNIVNQKFVWIRIVFIINISNANNLLNLLTSKNDMAQLAIFLRIISILVNRNRINHYNKVT
jgi:hypothetical protein